MPTFGLEDPKTGKVSEEFMSFGEKEKFLVVNPHVKPAIVSAPGIGDLHRIGLARTKPDAAFRDRLKDIKSSHRGSKINTW